MAVVSEDIRALLVADLHFSHSPPRARLLEKNWYRVQKRYMKQLTDMLPSWGTPILCAGDITNHWKGPPEFINFLLDYMPEMIAVPGQHDLPYHNYEELDKSVFYTLVKARKITLVEPDKPLHLPNINLVIYGVPFGFPIPKPDRDNYLSNTLHLALIHKYIWEGQNCYQGARDEDNVRSYRKALKGYDVAVFGDNHKGFTSTIAQCTILNCGTFLRRRGEDSNYQPRVGFLLRDGSIIRRKLDTTQDSFALQGESTGDVGTVDLYDFIEELKEAQQETLDFVEAVHRALQLTKVSQEVKKLILSSLEK